MIPPCRPETRLVGCALAIALVLGPTTAATAQRIKRNLIELTSIPTSEELVEVEIVPELVRMIVDLNAQSYRERQLATIALREAPFPNLQLYAVLERQPLSAEQRHRVIQVIAERLLTRPRGAVGIQINRNRLPEVVVEQLLPDLPAIE